MEVLESFWGRAQWRVRWQALRIVPLVGQQVGSGSWGGLEAVLQRWWIDHPTRTEVHGCVGSWVAGSDS